MSLAEVHRHSLLAQAGHAIAEGVRILGAAIRVSAALENRIRPDVRDFAILGIDPASMAQLR